MVESRPMRSSSSHAAPRRRHFSQALRALRRRRGVSSAEIAQALGVPLRSYQHFEAGRTRIEAEPVHRIALHLDADPYAIFAALDLGSPEFAVRAADNKLMTILVMALRDFDAELGDRVRLLDARLLSTVFARAFGELAEVARERHAAAHRWSEPPPDDAED